MTSPSWQFDSVYFSPSAWRDRVRDMLESGPADPFLDGNERVVRGLLEAEMRVVVNIPTSALIGFLADGRYQNAYERRIGQPSPQELGQVDADWDRRVRVDERLDIADRYFGALALGGYGVRYYGEWCLVLAIDSISPETSLFDRDSFDIEFEPLLSSPELVDLLRGDWSERMDVAIMTVLTRLRTGPRLVTRGTISDLLLDDQEFVEVQMAPFGSAAEASGFAPSGVESIRQHPDDVGLESTIRSKEAAGLPLTGAELLWVERRADARRRLHGWGLTPEGAFDA